MSGHVGRNLLEFILHPKSWKKWKHGDSSSLNPFVNILICPRIMLATGLIDIRKNIQMIRHVEDLEILFPGPMAPGLPFFDAHIQAEVVRITLCMPFSIEIGALVAPIITGRTVMIIPDL